MYRVSLYLFIYFSFLACLWHIEFQGQRSDPSRSWDLSYSCGNAGFLTHCATLVIEPASRSSQDTSDPIVPQQELLFIYFKFFFFFLATTAACGNSQARYQTHATAVTHATVVATWIPNPLHRKGTPWVSLFKNACPQIQGNLLYPKSLFLILF